MTDKIMTSKKSKAVKTRFSPLTVIMLIVLCLYAITLFGLLLWALLTAFKDYFDFNLDCIGLPDPWYFGNFNLIIKYSTQKVQQLDGTIREIGLGEMYGYSALYSLGCAFFQTLVPCLTAYACARFKNIVSRIICATVIVVMAVPIVGSLPAEVKMVHTLGLYGHVWGLWIMKANFLGIYFLLFYESFKGLPVSFREAAQIDGASEARVLFTICLPLVVGQIATVMLLNFITFWNDYQTPLLYMPNLPTVSYKVYSVMQGNDNELANVPAKMTMTLMLLIPVLVVFLCFQKKLLKNVSIGGIKG